MTTVTTEQQLLVREGKEHLAHWQQAEESATHHKQEFAKRCQALKDGEGSLTWEQVAGLMGCSEDTVARARKEAGLAIQDRRIPQPAEVRDLEPYADPVPGSTCPVTPGGQTVADEPCLLNDYEEMLSAKFTKQLTNRDRGLMVAMLTRTIDRLKKEGIS
jgi:hypothetical protein